MKKIVIQEKDFDLSTEVALVQTNDPCAALTNPWLFQLLYALKVDCVLHLAHP
jgi:hypothetical protein